MAPLISKVEQRENKIHNEGIDEKLVTIVQIQTYPVHFRVEIFISPAFALIVGTNCICASPVAQLVKNPPAMLET